MQANSARTRMVDEWCLLTDLSHEVDWWIDKSCASHYAEHLGRLREWTADLISRRGDAPKGG